MTFDPAELEAIAEFEAGDRRLQQWDDSPLKPLLAAAPQSKGRFARGLVEALAREAGVPFGRVPGRLGSRVRIGRAICELKFSTEDPPRFQQVRPPADGYDLLIGIGARPRAIVYWSIPAHDVGRLMDESEIAFQHAETSRWFFPSLTRRDVFSPYRCGARGLIRTLRSLRQ